MNKTTLIKKINNTDDLDLWTNTRTYEMLNEFVSLLCNAATKSSIEHDKPLSNNVKAINYIIERSLNFLEKTPCRDYNARFGNDAFRTFVDKITEFLPPFLNESFGFSEEESNELTKYYTDSMGHYVRLDYGTGHELSFLIFIFIMYKTFKLDDNDSTSIIKVVFWGYFKLVEKVQSKYRLEPAGSRGVWGVDDFQHLSFLFGAAQLIYSPYYPSSALDPIIRKDESENSIFFWSISQVMNHKNVSISESSPYLYNLLKNKSFKSITNDLENSYTKEVMNKFVVVQHLLFGSLFPFE